MKIKTLKSICNLIRDHKIGMPILDDFYIDKDFIYFSNLEILIRLRHKFPVKEDSKPMAIKSSHFIRRMENIKAPYSISCDDQGKIVFEIPDSGTTFKSDDPIDFPFGMFVFDPLKETEGPTYLFDLSAKDVLTMSIAANFVADDELRPVMGTVCLSKDFIVASDAHMLYSKKIKELYPKDLMFNVKVIKLMRLFPGLSYRISQQKLNLIAESDDVTIRWRGNDGNYPNWQSVVIVHPNKVIIPVKETINALDAVAFAVNDASHLVKWKISGNKLELSGTDRDFGISSSESVNIINPDNNEIEWGFKLDFIRKELETLFEEGFAQVDVRFEDNTKSILLADRLLLMPMMITD